MKLQKCPSCLKYTLKSNCVNCKTETKSAHYKFTKLRSVNEDDTNKNIAN